jgi:hypothetical protein
VDHGGFLIALKSVDNLPSLDCPNFLRGGESGGKFFVFFWRVDYKRFSLGILDWWVMGFGWVLCFISFRMGGLWGWRGGFHENFLLRVMEHGLKVWIFFLFIVCFQHNIRFECFLGFKVWRVGGGSSPLVFFDGEFI